VPDESLVSPDTWDRDFALVSRPGNDLVQLALFADYASNLPLYPKLHAWLRESSVPLLAVWGGNDEIFRPEGALAFAQDSPAAEIHLLDGGHFLLESHLDDAAGHVRGFLKGPCRDRTAAGPERVGGRPGRRYRQSGDPGRPGRWGKGHRGRPGQRRPGRRLRRRACHQHRDAARLVAVVADSYGPVAARPALVETILWWQDRCWRGIDAAADAGEPAMVRLHEQGAVDEVRAACEWTSQHRSVLERELT
jgi:hypothetical protein